MPPRRLSHTHGVAQMSQIANPRLYLKLARIGPLSRRLAECVKSCEATPEEAAQAAVDLQAAIQRQQGAPVQEGLMLKESE